MEDMLKGNFKVKRPPEIKEIVKSDEDLKEKFKKAALGSIGGSMVYVERTQMSWDGEDDAGE
jgi:hypothetical protein